MEEAVPAESPNEELTAEDVARLSGTTLDNVYLAVRRGRLKSRIVLTRGARAEHRFSMEEYERWRRNIGKHKPPDEWTGRTVPAVAGV
jgi:hypothetical protein